MKDRRGRDGLWNPSAWIGRTVLVLVILIMMDVFESRNILSPLRPYPLLRTPFRASLLSCPLGPRGPHIASGKTPHHGRQNNHTNC